MSYTLWYCGYPSSKHACDNVEAVLKLVTEMMTLGATDIIIRKDLRERTAKEREQADTEDIKVGGTD